MFKKLRKRNLKVKLEKQYKRLLSESYRFSTISRAKSDQLRAEAENILMKIDAIEEPEK